MTKMTAGLVVVGAVALTMTGCTTAKKHHFSGFLDDYSMLVPSATDKGALNYEDPEADFTQYKSLYVQPISVHFAHAKDKQAISPEQLKQYKDMVRDALRDALAKYQVSSPDKGAKVAELRFQAANIRLSHAIESPRTAYRMQRYEMGTANIEAAIVDGRNGRVLAMYVGDTVPPEWIETWSEQDAWASMEAHTRRAIERWVSTWGPKFVAVSQSSSSPHGEGEVE